MRSLCRGTERLRRSPPAAAPQWMPRVTGHDVVAYGIAGVMRFAFNRSDLLKDFYKAQGVGDRNARRRDRATRWSARTCGPWPPAAARLEARPADGQSAPALGAGLDLLRSPHDRAGQAQLLRLDVHRPADPDQRLERASRLVAHGQRSRPGGDLRTGSRSGPRRTTTCSTAARCRWSATT